MKLTAITGFKKKGVTMTGSLQTKNGKYYAVINLIDVNGKRKQKWISTGYEIKGNKKKAEQFLRDTLKEFEQQAHLVQTDIKFCDYVAYWLSIAKIRLERITYEGYANVAKLHIIPYFKPKDPSLKDITRSDIQTYVNQKFECGRSDGKGGLSSRSVKIHLIIMRQVFKEAVKNNLIMNNPCDYISLPKAERYDAKFYSAKQLNALFTAIKDEPLYPLIYFTAVFGLRRSEVLGLKWDSVDFENNTITVKHTVVRFSEVIEKDTTKNAASYRTYPLSAEAKAILLDLKGSENEYRILFGNEYFESDYIFKWENGKPYTPDFVSIKFHKLLEKYEFPIIRFHDLRHSCASLLIANGFSLKDIQEWLGHSDIQTTANIYAHLDVERKNKIANSMSNTLKF